MMPTTFPLVREHLQRAVMALQGTDSRSRQLRYIIERTVTLMEDFDDEPIQRNGNVLDLARFRDRANRGR